MSATTLSDTDAPAHGEGSWAQRVREHCAHEWASALLVASIVTIANLHFHWLRAFDTYTFLALGQLTSVSLAGLGKQHRTVVVEIDDATFEKEYGEKTPLDRAQLTKHLEAIYAPEAAPDIVVMDLDISPAMQPLDQWLAKTGSCVEGTKFRQELATKEENELYQLIKSTGAATVLLDPFPATNPQLACWRNSWRAWMEGDQHHVVFGDGEVPVRYGVHAELSENDEALVRMVERKALGEPAGVDYSEHEPSGSGHARRLDPRQLLKGVRLIPLSTEASSQALTNRIKVELETAVELNPHKKKVVFFGAAYGGDDLFLTAVGEIYGVEAHAAGYVSDIVKDHHVVDFILDFLIAIAFSLAIAFFWRKYFDARLSDNAVTRELAKLWIIGLVLSVLALVVFLSFVSLLTLRSGVWLSPIPLAIGMMFDSFVSGSVDQATHKFKTMRRALIEQLTHAPAAAGDRVDHSVSTSARNHPLAWGACHLPRALGGDICEHLLAHKNGAAALLGLWTVIWMSTAIFALVLAARG
jgi:CHASE2 domain-containing sensor protein